MHTCTAEILSSMKEAKRKEHKRSAENRKGFSAFP
jgi:hypothetical protein